MRVAELCAGYGGLFQAMRLAGWPVELSWLAEVDPDASKVLAAHHPDVPNIGDLTSVAWPTEPVDILAGGFPCQPVSLAGRQKGTDDERWIWDDIASGIGRMESRPRLLVFENVPGLLSANRGHAMARVVHTLARLGYVGRYRVVSAGDAGACHLRKRVFIVAELADPARFGYGDAGPSRVGGVPAAAVGGGAAAGGLSLLPTPRTSDTNGAGSHGSGGPDLRTVVSLLPTPRARDVKGAETEATRASRIERGTAHAGHDLPTALTLLPAHAARWGEYAPAIARWERVTGRPAPDPTEPGSKGQPRLSPRFVEWLMGLDDGYVTSVVGRNAALRILGNGVVPQQGALALSLLAPYLPVFLPEQVAA